MQGPDPPGPERHAPSRRCGRLKAAPTRSSSSMYPTVASRFLPHLFPQVLRPLPPFFLLTPTDSALTLHQRVFQSLSSYRSKVFCHQGLPCWTQPFQEPPLRPRRDRCACVSPRSWASPQLCSQEPPPAPLEPAPKASPQPQALLCFYLHHVQTPSPGLVRPLPTLGWGGPLPTCSLLILIPHFR